MIKYGTQENCARCSGKMMLMGETAKGDGEVDQLWECTQCGTAVHATVPTDRGTAEKTTDGSASTSTSGATTTNESPASPG